MNEDVKAISELPLIKHLTWIIPAGIVIFATLKIYQMVIDSKLKTQQNYINKFLLLDQAEKHPDSEITKELYNLSYVKSKLI